MTKYVEPVLTWEDHLEIEATGTLNPTRQEQIRHKLGWKVATKSGHNDVAEKP